MTRKQLIEQGKGMAFLSPWLIGLLGLTLLPVCMSFYYSLCDYSLLQKGSFVGLDNYRSLMWMPNPTPAPSNLQLDGWRWSRQSFYGGLAVSLLLAWVFRSRLRERGIRRWVLAPTILTGATAAAFRFAIWTEHYGNPIFWKASWNTLRYAVMALPAGMLVSLGFAMLLNVQIRGQAIYRTIIFLPSLIPMVASAMLWLWLFNAQHGLINNLLRMIGFVQVPPWLTDSTWAMPALALMSLWGVGNTVVIYLAGLQDVPRELYEAAEIDGAGIWGRLWHVTIPMISPVIFFNLIMAIIGTLQVFAVPYIMTQGGPARSTTFYTMYLYDNAFTYLKMGYASAMAWIQLVVIVVLTALAFWSSRKWVHYQGK